MCQQGYTHTAWRAHWQASLPPTPHGAALPQYHWLKLWLKTFSSAFLNEEASLLHCRGAAQMLRPVLDDIGFKLIGSLIVIGTWPAPKLTRALRFVTSRRP